MSSATAIRKKHMTDSVGSIINPKAPVYKRNAHADNLKSLKQLELFASARKELEAVEMQAQAAASKPTKYQYVESKVAQMGFTRVAQSPPKAPADSPETSDGSGRHAPMSPAGGSPPDAKHGNFLRRKPTIDPTTVIPKPFRYSDVADEHRKAPVPRKSEIIERETALHARAPPKDFIRDNYRAAVVTTAKPAAVDAAAPAPKRQDYGQVPDYLQQRKQQWADAAEEKRREAAKTEGCPPGHRLMPEDERLETLELLKRSMEEARQALITMKLNIDIPSALRRKADQEAKVQKMEDAITVFSRPKVFVKME